MSDTYNYNGGGMPYGSCGVGGGCNSLTELIVVILLFSMFGWGNGGFGGRGGEQADATAAKTAALVNQGAVSDKVSEVAFGVNRVLDQTGGIIEAVNTVGNRAQDGFARLDTGLCQLGHAQSMQAVNNYNGLTNQITELRFQNQQCCCNMENMVNNKFCETNRNIENSTATILNRMNQAEMDALRAQNLELKAQLSQDRQTSVILAGRACGSNVYGGCNSGCCDYGPQIVAALQGISTQLVNLQTSVNKIPTTATA